MDTTPANYKPKAASTPTDRMLADKQTQYVKSVYAKFQGMYRVFAVYHNPKYGFWKVAGEVLSKEKYKILTTK